MEIHKKNIQYKNQLRHEFIYYIFFHIRETLQGTKSRDIVKKRFGLSKFSSERVSS